MRAIRYSLKAKTDLKIARSFFTSFRGSLQGITPPGMPSRTARKRILSTANAAKAEEPTIEQRRSQRKYPLDLSE